MCSRTSSSGSSRQGGPFVLPPPAGSEPRVTRPSHSRLKQGLAVEHVGEPAQCLRSHRLPDAHPDPEDRSRRSLTLPGLAAAARMPLISRVASADDAVARRLRLCDMVEQGRSRAC